MRTMNTKIKITMRTITMRTMNPHPRPHPSFVVIAFQQTALSISVFKSCKEMCRYLDVVCPRGGTATISVHLIRCFRIRSFT